MTDPVNEGKSEVAEVQPDASGKYPETVPWKQYVGIKESLGKKLSDAVTKATSLEEQLKTAVKPEEVQKLKTELEAEKAEKAKIATELASIKEQTTSEKRNILISKGVPKEKADTLSGEALNAAVMVLDGTVPAKKPAADLGGGGGGAGVLKGSPMELAQQAYSKTK